MTSYCDAIKYYDRNSSRPTVLMNSSSHYEERQILSQICLSEFLRGPEVFATINLRTNEMTGGHDYRPLTAGCQPLEVAW